MKLPGMAIEQRPRPTLTTDCFRPLRTFRTGSEEQPAAGLTWGGLKLRSWSQRDLAAGWIYADVRGSGLFATDRAIRRAPFRGVSFQ
jgi:hypothetical protein